MALGLVGQKRGMTRIFTEHGESVPVTVVEVEPNVVTALRTVDTDGYRAVQVTTGKKHRNRINRAAAGQFAAANVEAGRGLWEFRLADNDEVDLETGGNLNVSLFAAGQKVDVTGTTIGKGYAGSIKRNNFSHQDNTHGNSISHRAPGSIGQCQTPGRVWKGKKMTGHLGDVRRTIQNLEIVRVDEARNLLLIRGAVPGSKGGDVVIRPTTRV